MKFPEFSAMIYDQDMRDAVTTFVKEKPECTNPQIVEDLQKRFPDRRIPDPRTVGNWRKEAQGTQGKNPVGQLHKHYSARDIAEAIAGWRERLTHWAPTGDYSVRMLWNYAYDPYHQMIIRNLQKLDTDVSRLSEEFNRSMGAGNKALACDLGDQISQHLRRYETNLNLKR